MKKDTKKKEKFIKISVYKKKFKHKMKNRANLRQSTID
jgi:hypothetical protein